MFIFDLFNGRMIDANVAAIIFYGYSLLLLGEIYIADRDIIFLIKTNNNSREIIIGIYGI